MREERAARGQAYAVGHWRWSGCTCEQHVSTTAAACAGRERSGREHHCAVRGHAWRVERSVRCSRAKLGPDPLGPTRGVPKGVETWEGGMEYHAVTFAIITAHAGPGKSILQLHTLLQAGTHTHALNTQTHIRPRTAEKQVCLNTRGGHGLGQAGWRACAHLMLRRPSTVRSSGVNCVCESCGICLSRVVRCILSVLFT